MDKPPAHFEGKTVPEHLKKAREKGFLASKEIHGAELSGFFSSFTDAAREISIFLSLIWLVGGEKLSFSFYIVIGAGLLLWKGGRSAYLGWARMERLHRLIEEERYEIEHHRAQEKEELTAMYEAKGLKGKLLEDTIDVLMADDNRLLQVMIEEEFGLSLETYEHPLSQALGAMLGAALASVAFILSQLFVPGMITLLFPLLIIALVSLYHAHKERNTLMQALIWILSISFLSLAFVYYLKKLLI